MSHGYRRWLYPLIELVVHVWVGSLLFALVFAPAVALEVGIKWLEGRVSETLLAVLKATKVAAVVLDALLYVVFLVYMGTLFVRELFGAEHSTPQLPTGGGHA
ncbi:MAG: hypothetical protein K2V38_05160 [Gemmataceae bacterium]|nr:hypothetical protein [Gemmataceae bacterium]